MENIGPIIFLLLTFVVPLILVMKDFKSDKEKILSWNNTSEWTSKSQNALPEWAHTIEAKESVLSDREFLLFVDLQKWASAKGYFILANVNLYSLLQVHKYWIDGRNPWFTAWRKIQAKQMDFVCINQNGETLFCIELDDRTHDRYDREQADQDKNTIMQAIRIPFFRTRETRIDRLLFLQNF